MGSTRSASDEASSGTKIFWNGRVPFTPSASPCGFARSSGKGDERTIRSATVLEMLPGGMDTVDARLLVLRLEYDDTDAETILLPLVRVSEGQPPATPAPVKPAVPVKKSLTAEYIVCLQDGKKFKSLKRHLRTQYNMTPEQYRDKWGLPPDYPMVAPSYAAARSQLAKQMGLGQQRRRRAK